MDREGDPCEQEETIERCSVTYTQRVGVPPWPLCSSICTTAADKALSHLVSWPSTLRPRGPFGELELDLWKNFLNTGLGLGLARRQGVSESCVRPRFCRKARGSSVSPYIDRLLAPRCCLHGYPPKGQTSASLHSELPALGTEGTREQSWARSRGGASPERVHCSEASTGIWQV